MTNLKPVFIREEIIKSIRSFFYEKNFHEVLVSVLNDTVPLEPNLHPFSTIWQTLRGKQSLYLSMSPERGLKRMLGMGMGNCFALGKSFRNLESSGSQHIPEFLMLEWYRENAEYHQIMKDTEELILYIQKKLKLFCNCERNEVKRGNLVNGIASSPPNRRVLAMTSGWKKISLQALFEKYVGDYEKIIKDPAFIFKIAKKLHYQIADSVWREVFDQIFVNEIENKLPKEPFFLVDFPSRISPLCKPQKDKPFLAERFELYIQRIEIGNGNTEFTDEKAIRASFEKEKANGGKQPIDEKFLNALKHMQKKSYAGIGLGVDRLSMLFAGAHNIKEVELLV